ncbi:hypothetical protein TWF694_003797 [Orbilia ellipsospora]|uniref:MATH domain-containing protein n=1 Tax=Orbilia ellipsospora TaxID=2528407 RepID=A0AAV9WZB5_9PEZI
MKIHRDANICTGRPRKSERIELDSYPVSYNNAFVVGRAWWKFAQKDEEPKNKRLLYFVEIYSADIFSGTFWSRMGFTILADSVASIRKDIVVGTKIRVSFELRSGARKSTNISRSRNPVASVTVLDLVPKINQIATLNAGLVGLLVELPNFEVTAEKYWVIRSISRPLRILERSDYTSCKSIEGYFDQTSLLSSGGMSEPPTTLAALDMQ